MALIGTGSLVGALLVVALVHRIVRRLGRRSTFLAELADRAHRPTKWLVGIVVVHLTVLFGSGSHAWRDPIIRMLGLALIAAGAWLVATLLMVIEDAALTRVRTDVQDNRHARRVHTQVTLLRRITVAVVAIIALGAMLMTFPSARAAGASVLASAGVIGAIAALAAQSLLGNVFAGMQIAFSDAIRLDDVVIVEKEWGRIEDITLTYIVVHLWDDRRLVLPTSYFMSHPFQNWTRKESALLGAVELDLDWSVPVEQLRQELRRVLEGNVLWDNRVCVLQATDIVGGMVRLRALVSAADAPRLWDLRCLVREKLLVWTREQHPSALPRMRVEQASQSVRRPAVADDGTEVPSDARMFGPTVDGTAREHAFSGPHEP
ncbi:mechanosensitive ion channel family protein [Solihabitans fulvus]|uniref:Mechanosensitive ion channel family protein n=2 Tax=Solihabitans fulvus TaxID=1892852 RepID=A0A5B2W4I3_9PSEU|nr:mechanosensitive ion channel family protein [Solihabitans fulvus]